MEAGWCLCLRALYGVLLKARASTPGSSNKRSPLTTTLHDCIMGCVFHRLGRLPSIRISGLPRGASMKLKYVFRVCMVQVHTPNVLPVRAICKLHV
jgi:hypothetical protein